MIIHNVDLLSTVLRPRQQSISYMWDSFTDQKTQPTVSKYWRNTTSTQTTQKYN